MPYTIRHFILTRFNLPLYVKDKYHRPTQTDQWLKRRFELFEKYTLPSVAAQSCTDFQWLCFFSESTPQVYRERIAKYGQLCANFKPVYYSDRQTQEMAASLINTIVEFSGVTVGSPQAGNGGTTLLVTTNLDNDDSLHIEAVAVIQAGIKHTDQRTLYCTPVGYQYFESSEFLIRMNDRSNHFLTVSETFDEGLQTVLAYRHTRAARQLPVVCIGGERPLWLEIVHDNNVSNDLRINNKIKNTPLLRGVDLRDYGLDIKTGTARQIVMSTFYYPFMWISTATGRLISKRQRKKEFAKDPSYTATK